VAGNQRTRLVPVDAATERAHDRFFAAHPVLEGMVRTVGGVVILLAGALGVIDLYNLAFRIGGRIVDNADIPTDLPVVSQVIGWLPHTIDLPIGLEWWQALLISAIPALFEFDRDVRRSNQVFGPGTREPSLPDGPGTPSSGTS
jgi:hypothetical protein